MVELDARAAELLKQAQEAETGKPEKAFRAIRLIDELERLGAKVDIIHPDGYHRYWSTHCRHADPSNFEDAGHLACSAVVIVGEQGDIGEDLGSLATVRRKPAQCKTCSAPCICDCHKAKGGVVDPAPWLVVGESGPEVHGG